MALRLRGLVPSRRLPLQCSRCLRCSGFPCLAVSMWGFLPASSTWSFPETISFRSIFPLGGHVPTILLPGSCRGVVSGCHSPRRGIPHPSGRCGRTRRLPIFPPWSLIPVAPSRGYGSRGSSTRSCSTRSCSTRSCPPRSGTSFTATVIPGGLLPCCFIRSLLEIPSTSLARLTGSHFTGL